jgi:hypothetical protein
MRPAGKARPASAPTSLFELRRGRAVALRAKADKASARRSSRGRRANEGGRARIPGVCERGATQPDGMQRRPNAVGVSPRAVKRLRQATPPNASQRVSAACLCGKQVAVRLRELFDHTRGDKSTSGSPGSRWPCFGTRAPSFNTKTASASRTTWRMAFGRTPYSNEYSVSRSFRSAWGKAARELLFVAQ